VTLGFAAAVATMVSAATIAHRDPGRSSTDQFWSNLHIEGVEASVFASLDAMKQGTDVIVVGTIAKVGPLRKVQLEAELVEEAGEPSTSAFVNVDIAVERMLKGQFKEGVTAFELFVPDAQMADGLLGLRPEERTMFFLKEKSDGSNAYRLVSTQGYLRDFGRVEPPVVSEDDWLKDLARLSFDDLITQVEG
jgi:hypothetical protein